MPTVAITVGGTTRYFDDNTFKISETLNGRNALSATIRSEDGSFLASYDAEVLVLEGATRIYGGLINTSTISGMGDVGGVGVLNDIGAVDFNAYASFRLFEGTLAAGITLKAALQLLEPLLTAYGVSLDVAQVNGPTLVADLVYFYKPVNEILDELSKLTGYTWEIDYNKKLRMYLPGATAAPFNITSGCAELDGDVVVDLSRENYHNKFVLLVGSGQQEINLTLYGDGVTRTFPLSARVVRFGGIVWINYDGSPRPVPPSANVMFDEGLPIGEYLVDDMPWTYDAATNSLIQRADQPFIVTGGFIEVRYLGEFPFKVEAENLVEQGLYGIREIAISVSELISEAAAQELVDALLAQAIAAKQVTYSTKSGAGLRVGMAQTITLPTRNLSGSFTIRELQTRQDGLALVRDVTLTEGIILHGTWRDTYKLWSENSGGGGSGGSSGLPSTPFSPTNTTHDIMVCYPLGGHLVNSFGVQAAGDGQYKWPDQQIAVIDWNRIPVGYTLTAFVWCRCDTGGSQTPKILEVGFDLNGTTVAASGVASGSTTPMLQKIEIPRDEGVKYYMAESDCTGITTRDFFAIGDIYAFNGSLGTPITLGYSGLVGLIDMAATPVDLLDGGITGTGSGANVPTTGGGDGANTTKAFTPSNTEYTSYFDFGDPVPGAWMDRVKNGVPGTIIVRLKWNDTLANHDSGIAETGHLVGSTFNGGWTLQIDNRKLLFGKWYQFANWGAQTSENITSGQFVTLAVAWEDLATNTLFYQDGVALTTTLASDGNGDSNVSDPDALVVGTCSRILNEATMDGEIAWIAIFNRKLSADEIEAWAVDERPWE
jgi:hypothetical protein